MSVVKPAIQYPVLIAYLEGANNYTWLHYRDGEKQLLAKSIGYFELQPELAEFIRIHKTLLVNPVCVERLVEPLRTKTSGAAQLEGGMVLPVSRRRWQDVAARLPAGLTTAPDLPAQPVTLPTGLPPDRTAAPAPTRLFIAVTANELSGLLLAEMTTRHWPHCRLQVMPSAAFLPGLLASLQPADLPELIVLDARNARQEQLQVLEALKQSYQFCWIPVVLLIAPTDKSIWDWYNRRANSVIVIDQDHTRFVQTMERVCRFWLETAVPPQGSRVA